MENSTTQREQDGRIRNEQLKHMRLSNSKIGAAGILCGDRPWKLYHKKAVELSELGLSAEKRQISRSQDLKYGIDKMTTSELWALLDDIFTEQRTS